MLLILETKMAPFHDHFGTRFKGCRTVDMGEHWWMRVTVNFEVLDAVEGVVRGWRRMIILLVIVLNER